MKAMLINQVTSLSENKNPLILKNIKEPSPEENEILIKVYACGVCHTEIDEIEGRATPSFLPIIPGHQIIGIVVEKGKAVTRFKIGDLAGVGWIYSSCGKCEFCKSGLENLCSEFKATGLDANGGYAEYIKINENFAIPISEELKKEDIPYLAPLLCAGAIGFRSMRLSNLKNNSRLGLSGFGGSAHLVLKMSKYKFPDIKTYVFARSESERRFAIELGADWAGDFSDSPPEKLDAIIDTTPVWTPIIESLRNIKPGGKLVINAIRKEEIDKDSIKNIDYPLHLWKEKEIKSVANVTRYDIEECLKLCSIAKIKPEIQTFKLEEANKAILELKERKIRGSKVLVISR
ncbi:MAG: zinc-dependent alcohol dehydrogenase family protein [Brevinematia bacterium]